MSSMLKIFKGNKVVDTIKKIIWSN